MKKVILADAGDAEGLWPRCWAAGGEPAQALEELDWLEGAVSGLGEALVPSFGNSR